MFSSLVVIYVHPANKEGGGGGGGGLIPPKKNKICIYFLLVHVYFTCMLNVLYCVRCYSVQYFKYITLQSSLSPTASWKITNLEFPNDYLWT